MIDGNKVIMEQNNEKIWFVEIARFEGPGLPIYKATKGYYLKSYHCGDTLRHIVTAYDDICTTVIRHLPDSRIYDTEQEALAFIELLNKGEAKYERY